MLISSFYSMLYDLVAYAVHAIFLTALDTLALLPAKCLCMMPHTIQKIRIEGTLTAYSDVLIKLNN